MKEALKITVKSIIIFLLTVWIFVKFTPNEQKQESEHKGWVKIGEKVSEHYKQ